MRSESERKLKPIHALSVCFALIASDVLGIQLPLGFTEVPSRPSLATGDKSRHEPQQKSLQKVAVNAIVKGRNVEEPANIKQLQTCAVSTTKKIDLRLLATQPSESNSLFKDIFLQCVEENQIPVDVYFVALKLDSNDDMEEKKRPDGLRKN